MSDFPHSVQEKPSEAVLHTSRENLQGGRERALLHRSRELTLLMVVVVVVIATPNNAVHHPNDELFERTQQQSPPSIHEVADD